MRFFGSGAEVAEGEAKSKDPVDISQGSVACESLSAVAQTEDFRAVHGVSVAPPTSSPALSLIAPTLRLRALGGAPLTLIELCLAGRRPSQRSLLYHPRVDDDFHGAIHRPRAAHRDPKQELEAVFIRNLLPRRGGRELKFARVPQKQTPPGGQLMGRSDCFFGHYVVKICCSPAQQIPKFRLAMELPGQSLNFPHELVVGLKARHFEAAAVEFREKCLTLA